MTKLSKNVVIYFIGNTINRFIGIIVLLIATHILVNKEDLGYFNYVSQTTNICLTLFCFQIWMAIIRFIFDYKNKEEKFKIISNGYFISCISFLIYTAFLIIYLYIHKGSFLTFLQIFFLSFSYVFNQSVQFACRGLLKNKLYVLSGVFGSFFYISTSLIFLFIFKLTSSALILSTAFSYLTQGLFIEVLLRTTKHFKFKYIEFKTIKKMLKYSIPTTLNSIAYQFNQSAYIWLLKLFYDDSAIGIFTPSFRMTSLVGLFVMSFNFAFQEYSFMINKSKLKKNIYNKIFNSFSRFISSGTTLLLPLTCIFFSFMVGSSYKDAKFLIPVLYLSSILDSIQIFLGSIMQAEKKVNLMFFSQLVGVIVTISSMFITTNLIGPQSAGVSMSISFLTITILRFLFVKIKAGLKFNIKYLFHFIPIYILTSYIFLNYNLIINFLYSILIFFYFIICNKNLILKIIVNYTKKIKHIENFKEKHKKT